MKSPIILKIFKGDQLLEVKQFEARQIIFGHDADVTVDLNDEAVSAIHCLIELRDSGYYVCDMGSTTGTKKNGKNVMDESISSGDNIEVGPFRIQFFVGAPKPKGPPVVEVAPAVEVPPVALVAVPNIPESAPPAEIRTPVKPVLPKVPSSPHVSVGKNGKAKKSAKNIETFAPASEIENLRSYLRPTKGPVVEVIVAWQERILSTYHFGADSDVTIGSGKNATIQIPSQFINGVTPFLELTGGCKVLSPTGAQLELVNTAQTVFSLEDLLRSGKVIKVGSINAVRLDQGELLCISLDGGTLQIFVRNVPNTIKPILGAPLDFTAGEFTGLIIALVIVSLTALYMSVYQPSAPEDEKKEDQAHIARFVYDRPPPREPTPPPPEKVKVEVPPPPPPPEPKKIQVVDMQKPELKKETKAEKSPVKKVEASKAAEVRPMPTKVDRPHKFTSTKQGGAVAISKTAGANAESAKDVNKMGLLSAFGGGGVRKQLDKAYSGSGELLGMADKATGSSGQNEGRAGDDIGSKFKDTGAGGKGTATQGISGIGTVGRSSGKNDYGGGLTMGGKGNVTIDASGADAIMDPGTIDREAVRRVVRSILNQIKSCYERQLRVNSSLEGKVVIRFEIVEQGRVRSSVKQSSTMHDPTVESCVAQRIREARFPEPPPGTVAVVDYPFVFGAQK